MDKKIHKAYNVLVIPAGKGGGEISFLMVIMTCAVIEDLRSYRISNQLVLAGLCSGFLYQSGAGGLPGIGSAVCGMLLPLVILFPLYLLRWMGAGDIKLLAAAGSYFTLNKSITCLLAAIVFGGIFGIFHLLKGHRKFRMSIPIFLSVFFVVEGFI